MTEQDWVSCQQPETMLNYLDRQSTTWRQRLHRAGWWPVTPRVPMRRKLRLFDCACCHRVWGVLDGPSRSKVTVAERFSEGRANSAELAAVRTVFASPPSSCRATRHGAVATTCAAAEEGGKNLDEVTSCARYAQIAAADPGGESAAQAALIRDIFGNPFRPVRMDARWRTARVMALAETINFEQRFNAMPALAGALARSGCTDSLVLDHCRSAGPHVRGCWVIDALLAKG